MPGVLVLVTSVFIDLVDRRVLVPDRCLKLGKLVAVPRLVQRIIEYRNQIPIRVGKYG